MNNSNNFNVCEKCGTANPIVAKYCYQCGAHLRTPEDPIVCAKCGTVNSGAARFCKFCGTKLYRGGSIKICPRCNHTVAGDAVVCDRCHFEFATSTLNPAVGQLPSPQTAGNAADAAADKNAVAATKTAKKTKSSKGGARFGGFVMFVLFAAFIYLLVGWVKIFKENWINNYHLCLFTESGAAFTGFSFTTTVIQTVKSGGLASLPIWKYIVGSVFILAGLTAVIALLVNFFRIFGGKLAKKAVWWYFIIAIISGIAAAMFALSNLSNGVGSFLRNLLGITPNVTMCLVVYIIPVFYLVAFLISVAMRRKKEDVVMDLKR